MPKPAINRNGIVLYQGPSMLDGAPIVCILTGVTNKSGNGKTGDLVQSWILRADVAPLDAVETGQDSSVCGNCPHRKLERTEVRYTGRGRNRRAVLVTVRRRTCYVNLGKGVSGIYKCFLRGGYLQFNDPRAAPYLQRLAGRDLRMGSYGEPTAVPVEVWQLLVMLMRPPVRTGYTHQWRRFPAFREWCMASCDSPADVAEARALGWRAFHVIPLDAPAPAGHVHCPSDPSGTVHVSCADCGQCNGSGGRFARNVYIRAHGPAKRYVTLPALPLAGAAV